MLHHNHIIKHLPLNAEYYNDDIAPIAPIAIERRGEQEWRYAVLSLELHGHVGIYSLLGVKMGLYARELLGAEAGAMRVVSYAGSTPPISCFNDGLQVDMDQALVVEEKLFGSCFETEDQKNAMGAFVEKRKPEPFVNR